MEQLAIIVPLKEGAEQRAEELLAAGPPFDLEKDGFHRHAVYLTDREAVFVFEGREVEWNLDELVDDAFHPLLQEAFTHWADIVEGRPRVARTVYAWTSAGAGAGA
ncbi:MAG TPA: hypothetical protein VFL41_11340 [Gaiellaceae bacterium]|nr:hypothetical protein [Gaiellaceae bacterium]